MSKAKRPTRYKGTGGDDKTRARKRVIEIQQSHEKFLGDRALYKSRIKAYRLMPHGSKALCKSGSLRVVEVCVFNSKSCNTGPKCVTVL